MAFLRSSARPQAVECFFCLSPSLLPPSADRKGKSRDVGTRWNWQCTRCGCWNTKDEHGNMVSGHPAMHNSVLNQRSFSLRGRPSAAHLPSTSTSTSPFCHSCLTNQTLIMNLLANYLPDDSDPTFPQLYAELPAYLARLHQRYPPVCPSCQPGVDDALRRSDHRAQVEAWGSALKRGAGERVAAGPTGLEVLVWRIRGALFLCGTTASWILGLSALLRPRTSVAMASTYAGPMAVFQALSILWVAWDPHWLKRVRSHGRTTVVGRSVWVRNNLGAWLVRTLLAAGVYLDKISHADTLVLATRVAFVVDLALVLLAAFTLRVSSPVALRLVRPASVAASPPPSQPTLSSLSLSHAPEPVSRPPSNPIFGQPSLAPQPPDDAMDWEPAPARPFRVARRPPLAPGISDSDIDIDIDVDVAAAPAAHKSAWDTFGTGRQRVFAPPQETGLESLLAGWGIAGEPARPSPVQRGIVLKHSMVRPLWLALAVARLAGAAVALARSHAVGTTLNAVVFGLEAAVAILDQILCETKTRTAWSALNIAARAAAPWADPSLGDWQSRAGTDGTSGAWAVWAALDVAGAL